MEVRKSENSATALSQSCMTILIDSLGETEDAL